MICRPVSEDLKSHKHILVKNLKRGDNFIFSDYGKDYPYVYIVTDVSLTGVEVVSSSGKVFTFGKSVPVIPVQVTCDIELLEVRKDD